MSRREGELTVCERCGEQLFVEKEGEIIQDGGFTITPKLKERPKGWELVTGPGGTGYLDVCPKCYERHLFVRTSDVVYKGLWKLFPAINVDVTKDIPKDYPGPMGVPISFMDKYVDSQFELLGKIDNGVVNGKRLYKRLLIRNLKPELPEFIDLSDWFDQLGVHLEIEVIDDG